MRRSRAKSEFLRRESGVWAQNSRLKGLLEQTNKRLTQKGTEVEDLTARCDTLRAEASEARGQVVPLSEKVRKLEDDLARVTSERDTHRQGAMDQAAIAGALGQEVEQLKSTLQRKEETLAEAVRLAEASSSEVLTWKTKAEGNRLCFGDAPGFHALRLFFFCVVFHYRAGKGSG